MTQFKVPKDSELLVEPYPPPALLGSVGNSLGREGREAFIRLWLTEGIPFAFKQAPMLFEYIRGWLAFRLGTHPKEITIIGSARIGYSLASAPNFGTEFGHHSDLDFTVISRSLFDEVTEAFRLWKTDYEGGVTLPSNPTEERYWPENLRLAPKNIARGFLDTKFVPNRERYPKIKSISQTMFQLKNRLDATPTAPRVRQSSVRVYRDWGACLAQIEINFERAIRSIETPISVISKLAHPGSC